MSVSCNGHELQIPHSEKKLQRERLGQSLVLPAQQGILGFPANQSLDNTFTGVVIPVPVESLVQGTNRCTFTLKRRGPGFSHDLRISRIELETLY